MKRFARTMLAIIMAVAVIFSSNCNYIKAKDQSEDVKNIVKTFFDTLINPIRPENNHDIHIEENLKKALSVRNQAIWDHDLELYDDDYFTILDSILNYKYINFQKDYVELAFEGVVKFKCKDKEDFSLTVDDYYIKMVMLDGDWCIYNFYSTNPWDELFKSNDESIFKCNNNKFRTANYNTTLDIQKFNEEELQNYLLDRKSQTDYWERISKQKYKDNNLESEPILKNSVRFYDHGYNRANVKRYLSKWAYGFNPEYETLNRGRDCANFASQAMRAGGIVLDGTGPYQWNFNSPNPNVKNCSNPRFSWFNARGLHDYCKYNGGSPYEYGISVMRYWLDLGDQYYSQSLKPGDLVFIMDSGVATHSMVVHSAGANAGMVGISAHSRPRLDHPLSKLGLRISDTREWLGMYIRGNYGF